MTSFNDFGLAEPITRALAHENYVTPTPIQTDAIPIVNAGRDLVGIAQTGTGKTAAFALPILNRLAANPRPLEKKACRVLVLSPTRELSIQILDSFRAYGRHLRLSTALAIGGVTIGKQVRALMGGVDVLVATPGRLLDLVRGNALRLGHVDTLVLDEADRMLDMGFIHDIRKIIAKIPTQRQTLLFSATMPREIAELAADMLRDPARVAVTPVASTVDRIAQRVIHTDRAAKPALLVDTLRNETIERALIFTRTKHGADKVVRSLAQSGIVAEALHGNKSQNQRERVMGNFRSGRVTTLVATDIAARGIDVTGISHVINYDLPNIPESYVHRIGRTARAGADGVAISFCDAEEAAFLRDIEKLIRMAIPASGEARGRAHQHSGQSRPQQSQRPQARQHAHGRSNHQRPAQNRAARPLDERPAHNRSPEKRPSAHPVYGQPSHPAAPAAGGRAEDAPKRSRKRRRSGGGAPATGPHSRAAHNRPAQDRPVHDGDIASIGFLKRGRATISGDTSRAGSAPANS
ncbi:MAG: DEAD/DEAH box helicase [Variibacter sp.]|nr:DEAD/DEAH box helicase [Variibacter sp.]